VADGIGNGHTVQGELHGADSLTLGDESFKLLSTTSKPSENTVDGKHFAMEMHLVHKSDAGKLAVLGVFIEEGAENAAYAPVWSNLPKQKGMEFHLEHVKVNVDDLLPAERSSYRFDGSLTTPPCTEGVKWLVLTQPAQLSAAQVAAFRAVIHDNNRPTQPLNGRKIVSDRVKASGHMGRRRTRYNRNAPSATGGAGSRSPLARADRDRGRHRTDTWPRSRRFRALHARRRVRASPITTRATPAWGTGWPSSRSARSGSCSRRASRCATRRRTSSLGAST
jgi:hypothetical protein